MFRYSSMRFNLLLLNQGEIRIGTLHDFRCLEHKRGVYDPQEGKKVVSHHIKDLFITDPLDPAYKDLKDFKALEEFQAIKLAPTARGTKLTNITTAREIDSPDFFILCTSKYCSARTMSQFEGADSCLEIVNVNNFYHELTKELNSKTSVIFQGIHEVVYQKNREEPWSGRSQDWGRHPALIKELIFEPQGELRAIWQPRSSNSIEPIIIRDNRLGAFCRIISM